MNITQFKKYLQIFFNYYCFIFINYKMPLFDLFSKVQHYMKKPLLNKV
jgi:hypothetical protein